jgi:hypothetical protein
MNLKRFFLLLLAISILASVSAIFFAHPAVASNPLAVTVTNTPLPVQGTVNARQNGNWNVGVSGTVNVASMPNVTLAAGSSLGVSNSLDGNGNPSPLLTRDSDNPALHPYLGTCSVQQSSLSVGCTTTAVPVGKTLVVEEVDEFIAVPSGQGVVPLNAFGGDAAFFALTFVGSDGTNDRYVAHQLTRMYQPANGPIPGCGAAMNTSSNLTIGVECAISGYLVDTP